MNVRVKSPVRFKNDGKVRQLFLLLRSDKSPILFVNRFYGFKKKFFQVVIEHKPIKYRANFGEPNIISIDFRNSLNYLALSIAHEYAHLLLRRNGLLAQIKKYFRDGESAYSFEQALAIMTQLSYENFAGIRPLRKKTINELMTYMKVDRRIFTPVVNLWNVRRFNMKILSESLFSKLSKLKKLDLV